MILENLHMFMDMICIQMHYSENEKDELVKSVLHSIKSTFQDKKNPIIAFELFWLYDCMYR